MINRKEFVKSLGVLAASWNLDLTKTVSSMDKNNALDQIIVKQTNSNFEREKLLHPFGFKGGYLTELWQTVSKLQSASGASGIGIATQSVLYADADLFAACSEAEGNALMYLLANRAMRMVKSTPFDNPVDLLDKILPQLFAEAKNITQKPDLNINFVYNALLSVDNAAWLLYAKEKGFSSFDKMLPSPYDKALSYQNKKIAIMYQVSYGMPIEDIKTAVQEGYFVIKIKTGSPGNQEEMLKADMERLTQVHAALKDFRTEHTPNGKLIYTLDANARYEKKADILRYLDHARKIGAFDQILLYEEPFAESNKEYVGDMDIIIAADESVHDEADAIAKIERGYKALVLKGIAKTLSLTLKIAKVAHDRNIPCLCADLTVNPILIDWNKNIAGRLAPFPGIEMGLMETNGDMNYQNWEVMQAYHPYAGAPWTKVKNGLFELDNDFYAKSGGIFEPSPHYQDMFKSPL